MKSNNWRSFFQKEFQKPYFVSIKKFINQAYLDNACFPAKKNLFRAFKLSPKEQVKVVILGQDPYFQPGQANGLAFSVPDGINYPPSLQNIFKELRNCYSEITIESGDLSSWARQGVLLLNSVLSVAPGKPGSHSHIGWKILTDNILLEIADNNPFVVFVLWGQYAQEKEKLLQLTPQHAILKSSHPSPFSANIDFFGSRVFQKINQNLKTHNLSPIDWSIKSS